MRNTNIKIERVYSFINSFIDNNGYSPSIREICEECDIKSTATAYSYLEKLKENGSINDSPLKKRSLTIAKKRDFKSIPLIGTIRAGLPIFAYENLEGYYPLPPDFNTSNEEFALRVQGDSMIKAGINENDIIIVEKSDYAKNGDIVVALIDDSATVKRYFYNNGKYILHPENDSMEDLIYPEIKILGIVKGLYRKF